MYKQNTCDSRKNKHESKWYELHCKTIRHVKTSANSIRILKKLGMYLAQFSFLATFVWYFCLVCCLFFLKSNISLFASFEILQENCE